FLFLFNHTAPAATYTLSLHDALPISSFQAGLVRTFRAAHEAMDNIARVSGPRVHDFFVNLVDMMERNLPLVGETIGLLVGGIARSEEHTSELQSRENLVCRLLLEKKK